MKNKILIFLKGFVFGIANIIPGVSGGTIALTMGIYEDLISSISNIFKKFKRSMSFLLPFILGAIISIISLSKVIDICLTKYEAITIIFFIGLIIGGIPLLFKNINIKKITIPKFLVFLITFSFILIITYLKSGNGNVSLNNNLITYLKLTGVGIITAATMIIPGISGSFVLMLMGYYQPLLKVINNITSFNNITSNILLLIPLGIGVVIGILLITKILEYLFTKYKEITYYGVIGFLLASIITLILSISLPTNIIEIIIAILLFIIGLFIGNKLGDQ